jgi:hypothetical protein
MEAVVALRWELRVLYFKVRHIRSSPRFSNGLIVQLGTLVDEPNPSFSFSFQPAPFFVLDEIDAALDNTNIGKVNSALH